jgi:hypothetical protein
MSQLTTNIMRSELQKLPWGHPANDHKSLHRKFGEVDYLMPIPAKTSIQANIPSSNSTNYIDYEITPMPGYYLKDNWSVILQIQVVETSGTGTITPNFAEMIFDYKNAFEWQMDGQQITTPFPSLQCVFERAPEMSEIEYITYCNMLNHDKTLAYTSAASVASSGTAYYTVRIPSPFPKYGFWLGALESDTGANHKLTLRVRTQPFILVGAASTVVLALNNQYIQMLLDCTTVPPQEQGEMRREWRHKHWKINEMAINEQSSLTLAISGQSTKIQLTSFRDLPIHTMYSVIHIGRIFGGGVYGAGITTTGWWSFSALPDQAQAYIVDKNGTKLFISDTEFAKYNKYMRSGKQQGDSAFVRNVAGLIYHNICPDEQARAHLADEDSGKWMFTGDEYYIIQDAGATLNGLGAVYVDQIGLFDRYYEIDNGVIKKIA